MQDKTTISKWFKKNLKIIFFLTFSIMYFIWIISMILIVHIEIDKRMEIQYNKIIKTIDMQKQRILNEIKFITQTYAYSVDIENLLESIVEKSSYISAVIDYKPFMDIKNSAYPKNINPEENIKEAIKRKAENLKNGEYIFIDNEHYICYVFPYFYKMVENYNIFQGVLIFKISKESLLNEIKNLLVEGEQILKNKPEKIFGIKYKNFEFYNNKYYFIINLRNRIFVFFEMLLLGLIIIVIMYYIIKKFEMKYLNKNIIKPLEKFSNYIKTSKYEIYNENFEIQEYENLKNAFNKQIKEINNNILKLESAYEETTAMNEELTSMNEELNDLNNNLETYIERFNNIMKIISSLSLEDIEEKDFFNEILNISVKLIPGIEYGSILVKNKGYWSFVATLGHDYNILKKVAFPEEIFIHPEKIMIKENLMERDELLMEKKYYEILKKGSKPYKKSILCPMKIKDIIIGQLTLDTSKDIDFSEETLKLIESLSIIATTFVRLKRISKEEGVFHKNIILVLIKALEYYDKYTKGHSERVAKYSTEFAEFLNLNKEEIRKIYWASITHDIGKFFIPQTILNKPERLSDEEFEIIKKHPVKSSELLSSNAYLEEYSKIVRHHHERWDGTGYPDGLKGKEIPYISRIITLADSFDAMITIRPYKRALSIRDAIEEIKINSGTQFDPILASKFIEFLRRKYL
ncbi:MULTISPECIES: HD-GYP domain-containing protein [unclassified Marinitoga]|uniref:HD-GYP domain-containing protein n=1 Tax=unclassified Marinitoga TaxID=2640159 RepID=UPI00065826E2|nr:MULTISPECIES: HD-GYP domain-containing protein [unclassified Marinitoga]KLO23132.1 hypothetical protein X274_06780 [Marinitoga sp. 1155]